jgi:hypothetical protein
MPIRETKILQRVEPLQCDDRMTDKYMRSIFRQLLCKHVPAATNRRATIEVLLETGCFYVVRAEDHWRDQVSSVWRSVKNLRC